MPIVCQGEAPIGAICLMEDAKSSWLPLNGIFAYGADLDRGGSVHDHPLMAYKPDSYTDLAPYLLVQDAEAVLTFCETVFAATRPRVISRDAGGIMHAEYRIGDTVLMMGEADGPATMLHLYLEDPDAAFDRAVAAGAEVFQVMTEKGDGDQRGGFRSPDGTRWFVARQVSDG